MTEKKITFWDFLIALSFIGIVLYMEYTILCPDVVWNTLMRHQRFFETVTMLSIGVFILKVLSIFFEWCEGVIKQIRDFRR